MYCRKCGRQMGQSKFCRYCGAERLDAPVNSTLSQPPVETKCASSCEPVSSVAAVGAVPEVSVAAESPSPKRPDESAVEQQASEPSVSTLWYKAPELDDASTEEADSRDASSGMVDRVLSFALILLPIALVVFACWASSMSSSAEDGSHGWENPYEGTWRIGAMYLIDSETFEVEQSGEASGTIEIADNKMLVDAETGSGEKLLSDEASFIRVDANVCAYGSEDGAVWIVDEMGDGSGISAICTVDSAEQYLAFGMFYDTE